ncbi:hypothetical protein SLEP1_g49710 [Rubroshorea leprosula]|uniref:Uncharacterized protein n=1 Tax=Rubroshorea leprosula TaxID=152421 RepID=A0AAV5LXV4_9ROSI|nr:hypothetical protein SLEP1_g49710 [Rubroshorea leprosula]
MGYSSSEILERERKNGETEGAGKREKEERRGGAQVDVDLEKMKLGEWFDFLEVHLPKQIIEQTEKMIEEMRRKAERVHDYLMEQKKEGKVAEG